MKQLPGLAVAR